MTCLLGETKENVLIPGDLFQEFDDGRLELAGGESSDAALAPFRLPHHGGAGVVEEALAILADLAGGMGRHRGAAVAQIGLDHAREGFPYESLSAWVTRR